MFCQSVFTLALAFSWAGSEIVGGHSVSITEAPWQLWIGNCGATWVGGRNVITAGHCIMSKTPGNTFVWAGITRRNQATTATRIAVAEIIKKTTSQDLSQDIAILKLAADIPAGSLARPIRYATPADVTAGYTAKGVVCMASGWGKLSPTLGLSDSLQLVMSKIYSESGGVIRWAGQGGTQHVGSCQGDSGGPLVVKDGSGNWILAGASSYISSFCGDPNSAASYARVSAFATWYAANGVPQPSTTPILDHVISPQLTSGYFQLAQAQNVALTVSKLNGATVMKSNRFYPAGKHAFPSTNLAAGGYILRMRGKNLDVSHRVPALP